MIELDVGRPYLSARLTAAAAWAARVGDRPWLPNLSGYLRRSPAVVATHPLAAGHPPRWACGWGHDKYGPYADLAVGRVKQRFRWCPPGSFQMGSPEGEAGRYSWEGPQHEVTLSAGYWMADSPVTQALWLAVTGENPSHFADPAHLDRPVEMVDWPQAARFCALLEERLQRAGPSDDGLVFRLPTEAEWEYACRAGTQTATYAGDLTLRGENDAPELDAIAWYGGNSGVDYDLAGGTDSSGWPKKQHPHSKAGTRVVKQKAPNAWGLYDTLGNVWEWCADAVEPLMGYPGGARVDPLGEAGPLRTFRGGSWFRRAREARAAYRNDLAPSDRRDYLGLRLSRGRMHQTSPVQSPDSE
ncbi:MAG: formylglycine-generating enzyme family protein [Deltaproteobacteria bacterium]|nr:formylglycine-generating enzyme family protein [Deltaproteobacteria bacterium]